MGGVRMPRDASQYVESAHSAGLWYVTDTSPGYRRRRAGKGFIYLDTKGRRLTSARTIERIRKIVIPPAWTDVWICPTANGHIQATGRDAKGRKQYRYHQRYREVRDETKFERILAFSRVFPRVREVVERDLAKRGLPRQKVLATVVRLLETTFIRVGNDEYARDNASYGLTTLQDHHALVRGRTVHFEFRGKSGVEHAVSIYDQRLATVVQHCQDLPGEQLFKYVDGDGRSRAVDSGDINEYLAGITGSDFTAKDVRTWAGTVLAAAALRDLGVATTKKDIERNIRAALDTVAERLGNTRAVCLKYYVHPDVLDRYRSGQVITAPHPPEKHKRTHKAPDLRGDEVAVLQLLELKRTT